MQIVTEGFASVAALLVLVGVLGAVALLLRQPLVVAFLVAGILGGPAALGLVRHGDELEVFAELGIAILLFLVGLKLDIGIIRQMGAVALLAGLVQVAFTAGVGLLLAQLQGWSWSASAYIALALSFSSTIIIVKLLSDRRDIDSLHGRLAVGILIIQDIVVILALLLLPALDPGEGGQAGLPQVAGQVGLMLVKAVLAGGALAAATRWMIPKVAHHLARSTELLLLASIAWAVGLAASADVLGFSKEVGAFVAGVSLASTPFREAIGNRLVPLRDFLLVFFFIELGAGLELDRLAGVLLPAIALSLFVLVGKPIVIMAILGVLGYHKRTGFFAGLTLGQISEFSLILGALGVSLGHLPEEGLALLTLVALITIACSTYGIVNLAWLYDKLASVLGIFERDHPTREFSDTAITPLRVDVILIGLGRYGGRIGRQLSARGLSVYAVDFDPGAIKRWTSEGRHGRYGDATDPELCSTLPLSQARLVVCSAPDLRTNRALLDALHKAGYDGEFAATAHNHREARELRRLGADLVLEPFTNAADEAADRLEPLAAREADGP
ncbi:MAG: cation:proton antiporter [Phycisphaerales bacterium JB060]